MYRNLSPGALGVGASLPEAIRYARAHGFGGVDVSMGEVEQIVSQQSPAAARELFQASGVRPGGWGLPMDYRADAAAFREGLATLERFAKLGQAIGATRVCMWILPFSDDVPFAQNYRFHVERFSAIAQVLADYGCRIGLEFIGPKTLRAGHKYPFIHTLEGMLAMCAGIGDNAGLLLDCWHWYTAHGTMEDLQRLANNDVVYVHVNDAPAGIPIDEQVDNVRCLPGETGVIDLAGFLRELAAIGYDGPVTPEPFSAKLQGLAPDEAIGVTARALEGPWKAAGLG